jgi:polygalacturonase
MASSIQLLRSNIGQERPFPGILLDGQPAINTNSQEPGLFFKTSDNQIIKIGPAAITSDGNPPNANSVGQSGNSIGEIWLDKSTIPAVIKVFDGTDWVGAEDQFLPDGSVTDSKVAINAGIKATKLNFIQSGAGAVTRTVDSKLREVVSVKDFGAVGDGVTDDRLAFQRAFNYVNSIGGGVVYMPPGRYRKADAPGSIWTMFSNTTLCGEGDSSVIFHDDRSTQLRSGNDMLQCNDASNITFRDFRLEGTALTELTELNHKQTFSGSRIEGLRFINVTIKGTRFMATSFNRANNVLFSGNRIEDCIRDGLRCTNCSNVVITGNMIKNVADDAIATHALDSAELPSSGVVITNNVIESSQGIKVLGAKVLDISNNIIRRTTRGPIDIKLPDSGSEGNTPQFAINITNNIISDTFADRGINRVIQIQSAKGRDYGSLLTKPGVSSPPYDFNYLNNIDTGSPIYAGQYGINISNNQIIRTLPSGVNYSSWGYGLLFDRTTVGLFSDPFIGESTFNTQSILIDGPTDGLMIQNNFISGQGEVFFRSNTSTNTVDFQNVVISGNVFHNSRTQAIRFSPQVGSGPGAAIFWIHSNIFDIDPFFRNATHNSDNTWTSLLFSAINPGPLVSVIARNNVFKNCAIPYPAAVNGSGNIFYADVVAPFDNAANKGIRFVPSPSTNLIVSIDGDPASATYNNVTSTPLDQSDGIPTAGKYVKGHIVYATGGDVVGPPGSKYIITGWRRLTTGSNHILNTDWAELRSLTGT